LRILVHLKIKAGLDASRKGRKGIEVFAGLSVQSTVRVLARMETK
jgi:hypothetical protein